MLELREKKEKLIKRMEFSEKNYVGTRGRRENG